MLHQPFIIALYIAAGAALAYSVLSTWAALQGRERFRPLGRARSRARAEPGVTILKPLCGDEPGLYENLRSFCVQAYPDFQIIFGLREADDPARPVVSRLLQEFPQLDLSLVVEASIHGQNLKISNLINMMPAARHDVLVLADSDIAVGADYLRRLVAPLRSSGVGLVTCLYSGCPRSNFWSELGSMFIDDWFAPSARVSRMLGSTRFSFGSTIALRREVLAAAGGFEALRNILADDYWLGEFTRQLGLRTVLSDVVVTTDVTEARLAELWRHELRWLRTVRSVEPLGYAFLPVTFTMPVLAFCGVLHPSAAMLGLAGLGVGMRVAGCLLHRRHQARRAPLWRMIYLPWREWLLAIEWAASFFGSKVYWRNRTYDASRARRRAVHVQYTGPSGVIINADDFGLHPAVNAAVELAHTGGVLRSASLMVAAPAAADAINRARRLPELRVGLHLVLTDGRSTLPAARVRSLVDAAGEFRRNMIWQSVRLFFSPRMRRELRAEVRAQFEAFVAAGLQLDHVNSHKHFHLHPTILSAILEVGRDYGVPAIRLPLERAAPFWLRPWIGLVQARLWLAGIRYNDWVVGIVDTGNLDQQKLVAALRKLSPGVTELYFHPATLSGGVIAPSMSGYHHADELAALVSPQVQQLVSGLKTIVGGYRDVFPEVG